MLWQLTQHGGPLVRIPPFTMSTAEWCAAHTIQQDAIALSGNYSIIRSTPPIIYKKHYFCCLKIK